MLRQARPRHGKSKTIARRQVAGSISNRWLLAGGALVGALALSAVGNLLLAQQAKRRNPAMGKFMTVNGVRLHYVDRGEGEPVVMLHGNGSMIQDFEASGIVDMAAEKCRVIVFDRLGFGHTDRPSGTIWTPEAQADLLQAALARLDVSGALVLGHSWGASVAVALALRHPQTVGSLVLASGYYYPTARPDFLAMAWPATPVIGTLIRYTVAPLLGRLVWPLLMRKIFGPAATPKKFDRFPKAMALRPSQLRASAAESALLIPAAEILHEEYGSLRIPVVVVAGAADRLINTDEQSVRLHGELPHSTLHVVSGAGHMVHQTAPAVVLAAIHEAMSAGRRQKSGTSSLRAA